MFFVYILLSNRNNKTYVGFTEKTAEDRFAEHNVGSNKWNSQNKPFELLYYETYVCKEDALRREIFKVRNR